MNWRSLIVPLGVTLAIAGASVAVFVPTVPEAALVDAGIRSECPQVIVACPAYADDEAVARLVDAGSILARPGQRYVVVESAADDCRDAGVGLVIDALRVFNISRPSDPHLRVVGIAREFCTVKPCDSLCSSAKPWRIVNTGLPCVRAPSDGGVCLRSDGKGGWRDFGVGNVFPASESTGSGCEPVAAGCGALGIEGGREGEL